MKRILASTLLAAALGLAAPAHAQFGNILRQLPGNLPIPGNILAPAAPAPAQAGDLFQLLQQSVESIDEPKEIEIGRQLAAVLLGSKPLHRDMALQRYVNSLGR